MNDQKAKTLKIFAKPFFEYVAHEQMYWKNATHTLNMWTDVSKRRYTYAENVCEPTHEQLQHWRWDYFHAKNAHIQTICCHFYVFNWRRCSWIYCFSILQNWMKRTWHLLQCSLSHEFLFFPFPNTHFSCLSHSKFISYQNRDETKLFDRIDKDFAFSNISFNWIWFSLMKFWVHI